MDRRPVLQVIREAWLSVTEPRHLKIVFAFFYAVAIGFGMIALIAPPQSISGELGPLLTVGWGVLAILGGATGLGTVFTGWWFIERLGITLVWGALGIYLLVVVILQLSASEGNRWAQMTLFIFAGGLFYVRWWLIRAYSFEPRK